MEPIKIYTCLFLWNLNKAHSLQIAPFVKSLNLVLKVNYQQTEMINFAKQSSNKKSLFLALGKKLGVKIICPIKCSFVWIMILKDIGSS